MLRRRWVRFALGAVLVLAILLIWVVSDRPPSHPPPVQVDLTSTNGPLVVSPGIGGVLFVLPDGSLWRWGEAGIRSHRAALPERVGTDSDWAQATPGNNGFVAVKRDGTLWQAGYVGPGTDHGSKPGQVGTDTDWKLATKVDVAAAALKTDGTLWTWGDSMNHGSLGDPAVSARALPGQVGTNRWLVVSGSAFNACFLGITQTGELRSWGQDWLPAPRIPLPTPIHPGTNWTDIRHALLLDSAGGLWQRLVAGPGMTNTFVPVPIEAQAREFGTVGANILEIRPDGTLWSRPLPFAIPFARRQEGEAHPVGSRTDWVRLWSGMGSCIGMTRDGTLWAWGTDWGTEPRLTPLSRLRKSLHDGVNFVCDKFGIRRLMGNLTTTASYRRDETPRPILRLTAARQADLE